jgi:hypothetical protein
MLSNTVQPVWRPTNRLSVSRPPSISDVTARNTQINLKTALSTDKDYLNQWLPHDKREAVARVFNSCCDLMHSKVGSMDHASRRQFDNDWMRYRDKFIMSLSGDSHDVPTFTQMLLESPSPEQTHCMHRRVLRRQRGNPHLFISY